MQECQSAKKPQINKVILTFLTKFLQGLILLRKQGNLEKGPGGGFRSVLNRNNSYAVGGEGAGGGYLPPFLVLLINEMDSINIHIDISRAEIYRGIH